MPRKRSGAYALLVALYSASLLPDYVGYVTKRELVPLAQNYCNTSFTICDNGSRYTAWNSMATLLKRNLVSKCSNPAKYTLTPSGQDLASRLYTLEQQQPERESSTTSISSTCSDQSSTSESGGLVVAGGSSLTTSATSTALHMTAAQTAVALCPGSTLSWAGREAHHTDGSSADSKQRNAGSTSQARAAASSSPKRMQGLAAASGLQHCAPGTECPSSTTTSGLNHTPMCENCDASPALRTVRFWKHCLPAVCWFVRNPHSQRGRRGERGEGERQR